LVRDRDVSRELHRPLGSLTLQTAKVARPRFRMDSSWNSLNLKADSSESASVAGNLAAVERRSGEITTMIDAPSLKMGRRANLWENLAVRANLRHDASVTLGREQAEKQRARINVSGGSRASRRDSQGPLLPAVT